MLEANLARFRDRPSLLAALAAAPERHAVEPTRSGRFTLVERESGRRVFSQYDPAKEAARRHADEPLAAGDLPVLVGFNPFLLELIPDRPAIVVERDASLVKAILGAADLSAPLAGADLILDENGDRLGAAVRNVFDPFRHLRIRVIIAPHADAAAAWSAAIVKSALAIQRELSLNFMSLACQLPMWLETAMENLATWLDSPSATVLDGALRDGTAVVVGAGPSLERNVADLALLEDRAVIIAVDTALRRLAAAGIRPDIAVAVDANAANAKDVDGLGSGTLDAILAADQIASPAIVRAFRGPRVFLRSINLTLDLEGRPIPMILPLDQLMAELAGVAVPPSWQSGGSVSTNAFHLAEKLGARRVIFVGQDLAYTRNRAHAGGVGFEDDWCRGLDRFRSREGLERHQLGGEGVLVPAIEGGLVRTSPIMREYLHWFEATFENGFGRGLEIIDATEGGAKKRGARVMTLREAARLIPKPSVPPGRLLRKLLAAAPPAAQPGGRERLAAAAARARAALQRPEMIAEALPLARWIALPAYMGSHELAAEERARLIRGSLVAAATWLAERLENGVEHET